MNLSSYEMSKLKIDNFKVIIKIIKESFTLRKNKLFVISFLILLCTNLSSQNLLEKVDSNTGYFYDIEEAQLLVLFKKAISSVRY